MSPIECLTDVLSNFRQYRNPGSSGKGDVHRGLRHLKNLDEDRRTEEYLTLTGDETEQMREYKIKMREVRAKKKR